MEFEIALKLFEKMTEHGCTPDAITYGVLIAGLCKEGRLEQAQKLVDHMKESGFSLTEYIYNSVLKCCCKLGMYEEAVRLVDAMVENDFLPHLTSYKLLVLGLYDERKTEKAKAVFCTLLRCGYHNDEVAWKVLFDGLLKRGLIDRFTELLDIMEKKGFRPSSETYSMLIEGLDGGVR